MTKIELIQQLKIESAPEEIKEEVMGFLADMPDELSSDHIQQVTDYLFTAQANEAELALNYTDAANALEQYADAVDRNLVDEDRQIGVVLHDNLEAAQNIVN